MGKPEEIEVSETTSIFNDSVVLKLSMNVDSRNTIIFLHGFPGDSGKNEDIARKITETHNIDSYIVHYRGLGLSLKNGSFSFENSIKNSQNFIKAISDSKKYKTITLLGHSWGGLVAINIGINLFSELSGVILLAPFCLLPEKPTSTGMLIDFIKQQKEMHNKSYSMELLTSDYENTKDNYSPLKRMKSSTPFPNNVTIIQGNRDNVSLPKGATLLNEAMGNIAKVIEIDDDHWFQDRIRLQQLVSNTITNIIK